MSNPKGYITIAVEVKAKTEKAVLLYDGVRDGWVPLQFVEDCDGELESGHNVEVLLPEWLAKEKLFI